MDLPNLWTTQPGLERYAGVCWFRKDIKFAEEGINREWYLNLGKITVADVVYVNGVEIGRDIFAANIRDYRIPAELVKSDRIVIAIRVSSANPVNRGGFAGGGTGEDFFMTMGTVDDGKPAIMSHLNGKWKYLANAPGFPIPPPALPPQPGLIAPHVATTLFHGMIEPLIPYAVRGVIWYQGESNEGHWMEYRNLFPALIQDWRERWGYEMPFYWCQLANYRAHKVEPDDPPWARLREAQSMALSLPNTAEAILIDTADPNNPDNIHPMDKKTPGVRLSLLARKYCYGEADLAAESPRYESHRVEGNKMIVKFANAQGGLVSGFWLPPKGLILGTRALMNAEYRGPVKGFALAGKDGKFFMAHGVIEGDSVVITTVEVPEPVSVRYAWAENPIAELYSAAGLPTAPFQSGEVK